MSCVIAIRLDSSAKNLWCSIYQRVSIQNSTIYGMRHVVLPLSGNRTRITNVNCNNKIGRDVLWYVRIRLWLTD